MPSEFYMVKIRLCISNIIINNLLLDKGISFIVSCVESKNWERIFHPVPVVIHFLNTYNDILNCPFVWHWGEGVTPKAMKLMRFKLPEPSLVPALANAGS